MSQGSEKPYEIKQEVFYPGIVEEAHVKDGQFEITSFNIIASQKTRERNFDNYEIIFMLEKT